MLVDLAMPDAREAHAISQYMDGNSSAIATYLLEQDDWTDSLLAEFSLACQCRYYYRPSSYKKHDRNIMRDLETGDETFYKTYLRMTPASFSNLVDLIYNHEAFYNRSNRRQEEIAVQLAVVLDTLGHYGNGMASIRNAMVWDRSTGSLRNYLMRGLQAILSLEERFLTWPTPEERQAHSDLMSQKAGFEGCIGYVDGTTVPFAQRPAYLGDHFFDRKFHYSLNVQVICNSDRKILLVHTGFSGKRHVF